MDFQGKAVLEVSDTRHEYLNRVFKDVMRKSSMEHVWGILRLHISTLFSQAVYIANMG